MSQSKKKIVISYEEGHRVLNNIVEKLCNKCFNWFPLNLDYFYKNKSAPDGFFPNCKECEKQKGVKYRKEHVQHYREYNRKYKKENQLYYRKLRQEYKEKHGQRVKDDMHNWRTNNKDKVKQYNEKRQHKNHDVTEEQWINCKGYFDNKCAYCGLPIEEHYIMFKRKIILSDFHKEHFDDEGANDLSNCISSCKSCNSYKWKFTFDEWYSERNPVYSKERYNKILQWINKDYKKFI